MVTIGDKEKAFTFFQEAWQQAQALGNSITQRKAKLSAANSFAQELNRKGDQQQAIKVIMAALPVAKGELSRGPLNTNLLFSLAESYQGLNDLQRAAEYYTAAYSQYERLRINEAGDRGRARLDDAYWPLTNGLIDSYIDRKEYYHALALLESNKARTLSDIRHGSEQKAIYQQLTDLNRQHAEQRAQLFEHNQQQLETAADDLLYPEQPDQKQRDKLWHEYDQLLDQQQQALKKLQFTLKFRDVAISQSITAKQIEAMQQKLGKDRVIVALYSHRGKIALFLLTHDAIHYLPTELDYNDARRTIKELQAAIINPTFDLYRQPAQELADALIKPLKPLLGNRVKTVIYSPDESFSRIPLGLLPIGARYLAERFAVIRVPSLRLIDLDNPSPRTNATHGISCVDPEIKGARLLFQRETGEALEKKFGNHLTSLTGKECTPQALEQAIAANRSPIFLHIGAHGSFYQSNPMNSGIRLSTSNIKQSDKSGELWDAKAIGALDLSSIELMTLASCETAQTDRTVNRDLFGLMRTLLFSGVKGVIAPLWTVQDQSTSLLMQNFYRSYSKGILPEQALQQAQRAMIKEPRFSHPFFWSGFVLTEVSL